MTGPPEAAALGAPEADGALVAPGLPLGAGEAGGLTIA
jgi:hypothetical protein